MVAEKILLLAENLNIVIIAQDEADMCSLRDAKHIHANLLSQHRKANKSAAGHSVAATAPAPEEVFATGRPAEWRSSERPARDVPSHQDHPKPAGALTR
ncbi:unnamed protein product, partial [Lampetra planeri]